MVAMDNAWLPWVGLGCHSNFNNNDREIIRTRELCRAYHFQTKELKHMPDTMRGLASAGESE